MKDLKEVWSEIPISWKIAFFVCLGVTIGLLVAGFIIHPPGQIDDSVFKACGIIAIYPTLFTALICALKGMGVKLNTKLGELTVGKDENNETITEENQEDE